MEKGIEGGIADVSTAAYKGSVGAPRDGGDASRYHVRICRVAWRQSNPPVARRHSLQTQCISAPRHPKHACSQPLLPEDLTNDVMANWRARKATKR